MIRKSIAYHVEYTMQSDEPKTERTRNIGIHFFLNEYDYYICNSITQKVYLIKTPTFIKINRLQQTN